MGERSQPALEPMHKAPRRKRSDGRQPFIATEPAANPLPIYSEVSQVV